MPLPPSMVTANPFPKKKRLKNMTYRAERVKQVSAFHIVKSDTRGVFEESTMFIFAKSPLGLWEVRLALENSVGCWRFSSSFHVCLLGLLWFAYSMFLNLRPRPHGKRFRSIRKSLTSLRLFVHMILVLSLH